jgi:hypothetical protein
MTDRHLRRIDLGLVGHAAAMALPVDVHGVSTRLKAPGSIRQKKTAPDGRRFIIRD